MTTPTGRRPRSPSHLLLIGGALLPFVFVVLLIHKAHKYLPMFESLAVDLPAVTRLYLQASAHPSTLFAICGAIALVLGGLRLAGMVGAEKRLATASVVASVGLMIGLHVSVVMPTFKIASALGR